MKIRKVLILPGGTEIGLEIYNSLKYIKDIELFSAGSNVSNPAPFYFKKHYIIPNIYEKDWIIHLNDIIKCNNIDYIFPAYDDIIVELVKNKEKINAKIITSPLDTCLITRSKLLTYKTFKNILPVPFFYENFMEIHNYPVFVKPEKGQGSIDTFLVNNLEELKILLKKRKDLIALEYLPGKEYTIDCFSDRNKGLLFCEGRERIRIKSGITVNSKLVKNQKFQEYAESISKILKFYGAWFFQLKEDSNGVLKLLEIAPRIAGTMVLNRVRGINFPLLSIYEYERKDIEILNNTFDIEIDRALQNRYKISLSYNTVYLDLDDTLIIKGKINLLIIQFLFQCLNQEKRIILLTKHKEKISETLEKFKIDPAIFNEIILLKENELKSDYIKNKSSIFIDDSFQERNIVANRCKIPTFDCSMIECLIDEKF